MFEKENAYYRAHLDEFRQKYMDKELVIIGDQLIGVYDGLSQAVFETRKTHERNTFCVKHVGEPDPSLTCYSIFNTQIGSA
jgi:hypothetical protein